MYLEENMVITKLVASNGDYQKSKAIRVAAGHVHTLTFRTAGEKEILPDGSSRVLVSGAESITYIPKGVGYSVAEHGEGNMYAVHFFLSQEPENAEAMVIRPASPVEMENLFRNLCEVYRAENGSNYRCFSLLYEILAKLQEEQRRNEAHAIPKRIRRALEEINRHYDDPELSVENLARQAGVSAVYFRREFASCIGMSPIEYLTKVRMENAKALLGTALYSVTEVAIRCGFESISYFSQCFKKQFGVSPSQLRK